MRKTLTFGIGIFVVVFFLAATPKAIAGDWGISISFGWVWPADVYYYHDGDYPLYYSYPYPRYYSPYNGFHYWHPHYRYYYYSPSPGIYFPFSGSRWYYNGRWYKHWDHAVDDYLDDLEDIWNDHRWLDPRGNRYSYQDQSRRDRYRNAPSYQDPGVSRGAQPNYRGTIDQLRQREPSRTTPPRSLSPRTQPRAQPRTSSPSSRGIRSTQQRPAPSRSSLSQWRLAPRQPEPSRLRGQRPPSRIFRPPAGRPSLSSTPRSRGQR